MLNRCRIGQTFEGRLRRPGRQQLVQECFVVELSQSSQHPGGADLVWNSLEYVPAFGAKTSVDELTNLISRWFLKMAGAAAKPLRAVPRAAKPQAAPSSLHTLRGHAADVQAVCFKQMSKEFSAGNVLISG